MIRALTLLSALLFSASAFAGDVASRTVLGFSEDGRAFAFEEYGVQDGSGFPYATIYVVDVASDSYVEGAPIRVRFDDEAISLEAARAEAMAKAKPLLKEHKIAGFGGTVLTRLPTDLSGDAGALRFRRYAYLPSSSAPYRLTTDVYKIGDNPDCYDTGEAKGFRLILQQEEGGDPIVLHEDEGDLPNARRCAQNYFVHDVMMISPDGASGAIAVIVYYLQTGFEGPDGRYMVVTATLPN